jgi:hypothetical protein
MKTIRLTLFALVTFTAVYGDATYNITLNTNPLIGHPAGPFSIAFEFADGTGLGDGNNVLFLSNFDFGAGGPSGSPLIFGSVGGDLSSSVVMTDATPDNIFAQSFVPGNTLSFLLDVTTNVDAGSTPDEFIMSILDNTFTPIPTTAASPLSPFLVIDIDSSTPTVSTYSTDTNLDLNAGGPPINIAAPQVTLATTDTPEPSTALIICAPLVSLVILRHRLCRDENILRQRT